MQKCVIRQNEKIEKIFIKKIKLRITFYGIVWPHVYNKPSNENVHLLRYLFNIIEFRTLNTSNGFVYI